MRLGVGIRKATLRSLIFGWPDEGRTQRTHFSARECVLGTFAERKKISTLAEMGMVGFEKELHTADWRAGNLVTMQRTLLPGCKNCAVLKLHA